MRRYLAGRGFEVCVLFNFWEEMLHFLEMRRFGVWNLYWVRALERTLPTRWETQLNGNFFCRARQLIWCGLFFPLVGKHSWMETLVHVTANEKLCSLPTRWETQLNGNHKAKLAFKKSQTKASHSLGNTVEWKLYYFAKRAPIMRPFPLVGKHSWMETITTAPGYRNDFANLPTRWETQLNGNRNRPPMPALFLYFPLVGKHSWMETKSKIFPWLDPKHLPTRWETQLNGNTTRSAVPERAVPPSHSLGNTVEWKPFEWHQFPRLKASIASHSLGNTVEWKQQYLSRIIDTWPDIIFPLVGKHSWMETAQAPCLPRWS